MITFIYGENTYFVSKANKKIVDYFLNAEKSDLNLTILDGEKVDKNSFVSAANSMPFLGEKRLIVIRNFLTKNTDLDLKKYIAEAIKKIPETSDLVFSEEGQPDKRESIFKALEKTADKIDKFDLLDEYKCRQWIEKKVVLAGSAIQAQAIAKLFEYVGNDLWRMSQEIIKLAAFADSKGKKEIEAKDVELLVKSNNNFKIFDLTDALAQKSLSKAILVLQSFLNEGEEPLRILNLIIFQLRTMLIIQDLMTNTGEAEIAKLTKTHPYVVKKTIQSLKKFDYPSLLILYNLLVETDWKIKSGASDPTLLLTLLLVDFCKQ